MSEPTQKPPREPTRERMARLGLRNDPPGTAPRRVFRTKRYYRELDEITFSKPATTDTNKTK